MTQWRKIVLGVCLCLTALGATRQVSAQKTGTVVFDLKNYTSDVKLPKRDQRQLEHAGVDWGMLDKTLLVPLINEKFVKADTPYLTRFGEQKKLELEAGRYSITCVGYEYNSNSRDLDKALAKSAFFNNDVMTFTVLPGKTTTLEVFPTYAPQSRWSGLAKLTTFILHLKVRVLEDGTPIGEDVKITQRTAKSVAWDDYHGPLKF